MAVAVALRVEGQADSLAELQDAVAYLGNHQDIVEFSYHEGDLMFFASTESFPWDPTA